MTQAGQVLSLPVHSAWPAEVTASPPGYSVSGYLARNHRMLSLLPNYSGSYFLTLT